MLPRSSASVKNLSRQAIIPTICLQDIAQDCATFVILDDCLQMILG